ncbi:MAG TPA: phosphoglycerate transporter [Dehalococcoidia bacterium]|nr:phosphoglycerate transporter [Dehalococcoidia bacterium]
MLRLGWFSTGRDKAARDLLTTVQRDIERGKLEAEVAFVFSNREPGEDRESDLFLELVAGYNMPLVCFSSSKFRGGALHFDRIAYDREVMKRLEGFQPQLCILAGYMLIVGAEMCQRYDMINLHPAPPGGPAGTWQEVIWKLIEEEAEEAGVMMHLVTPELDKGPPVTYCTFPIRGAAFDKHWRELEGISLEEVKTKQGESNALFRAIRRHQLVRELPLIIATLKGFSQGKFRIENKQVVDARGNPIKGYDLSPEINEQVKKGLR